MQIKDVMTRQVDLVEPDLPIAEAARLMKQQDIGALPIGQGDKLVGMITDRDIVVRAVAENRDPGATPVRDAMSDRLFYCFDDQETGEVAANMGEQQIRRLPVMNRDKRLVGIVSLGDLSTSGAEKAAAVALGEISAPAP
ncbi:MAG: CBS domain-containing protein [Kiloniellaceae bacterium]